VTPAPMATVNCLWSVTELASPTVTVKVQPPAGLEAVGWFRSHTRSTLELDRDDHAMFEAHFAKSVSVALLLKPTHWGPADAKFFLRAAPGQTPKLAGSSFTIDTPRTAPQAVLAPVSTELSEPDVRPLDPRLLRLLAVCAMLLALVCILAYRARPSTKLDLQARSIAPGQVRIQWNQQSKPVLDAASGVLEVKDGESFTRIPLDHEGIRSSTVTYMQVTGRIILSLLVFPEKAGVPLTRDVIEFAGSPPPTHIVAEVRQPPAREVKIESPTSAAPAPAASTPAKIDSTVESSPPRKVETPRRILVPPAPRRYPAIVDSAVVLPPPPVGAVSAASNVLPDFLSRTPSAAAPNLPAAPKTPVYSGPRSGRLIWTGSLARRGIIEIERAQASMGSLAGSLPGVPLSFRISPSEFNRQGLVAFTSDPARAGRSEPPSKLNGWNGIHFELDAVRAQELVVIEAPNPTNDYARLVVRNEGRPYSVVVIDWTAR